MVTHAYEIQDILRKLNEGESFEALAHKYSKCSSATMGGDLGELSGKMKLLDPDFREACEMLQVGQMSPPIRTRFGHHLILRHA